MADVQYPAGQGAPAQAAPSVAQGIQPADELAAQAAGGQVAQVVQQVVGQDALPAAEHVAQEIQQAAAQEIQQAAAQVPQQAVGQAQPGELEVEYVYFCRLCVFFFINYEQGQGWQPFICLLLCLCSAFPLIHCSRFSHFLFVVIKLIGNSSVFRVLAGFLWVTICC